MLQHQLGNYPRDDASIQEDPHGGPKHLDVDSRRLHLVQFDHHLHVRLRALLDQ
jgi:hypothetical protein